MSNTPSMSSTAITPDYIVLDIDDVQPTPETTVEDAARFRAAVEQITGVETRMVGEIATTGSTVAGPVTLKHDLYYTHPGYDADGNELTWALPEDWYERAWDAINIEDGTLAPRRAHLRNPHDDGYDIATGQDISAGTVLGTICSDKSGWADESYQGFVLTWLDEAGLITDQELPDDADDAVRMIAARGYTLDESSIDDLRKLAAIGDAS